MVKVFVPRERSAGETRVAGTPETAKKLTKEGFEVLVESGAGAHAHFPDQAYADAGAKVVTGGDARQAYRDADVVVKVAAPGPNEALGGHEAEILKEGAILIGFATAHKNPDVIKKLRDRKVSFAAMELVPRISRAQTMDALSSQASLAGYKAALLAATNIDKYFPLLMTSAGTIQPAKIVIMGAGVAGLQALATAKRLGAIVEVSDIRPAVKEQVASLGGRFIDVPLEESGEGAGGYAKELSPEQLKKQQEIVAQRVVAADAVITTALVPGRPAPKLITEEMVKQMREGAVVVDMAVEQGGNCWGSKLGEEVVVHGVKILGPANIPATLPLDASLMYARNVQALLLHLAPKGAIKLDFEDEITRETFMTHAGEIRHAPTAKAVG